MAALFSGLIVSLLFSGFHWLHCRDNAYAALQNLEDCRQLADQIEAIKTAPAQASLEQQTQQDLAKKIEQAAHIAEFPKSAIASITPQTGRRMGNSSLQAHPTSVQIREIPMKQLVRFLMELSSDESGLQATSLRLTAPRTAPPSEAEERWSVELILTYLVFSPEYAPPYSAPKKSSSL
jgi:hypothetical protein